MFKKFSVAIFTATIAILPISVNAATEIEKAACIEAAQVLQIKSSQDQENWSKIDTVGLAKWYMPNHDDNITEEMNDAITSSVKGKALLVAEKVCKDNNYSVDALKEWSDKIAVMNKQIAADDDEIRAQMKAEIREHDAKLRSLQNKLDEKKAFIRNTVGLK